MFNNNNICYIPTTDDLEVRSCLWMFKTLCEGFVFISLTFTSHFARSLKAQENSSVLCCEFTQFGTLKFLA